VSKEMLVAGAEIVQARLSIRRPEEAMLGAFAVAGEANGTLAAVARQRVQFVLSEFLLLR